MSEYKQETLDTALAEARKAALQLVKSLVPIDESTARRVADSMNAEFSLAEVEAAATAAHKEAFMIDCPADPDATNCGMTALQHLIDNDLVMIDLYGSEQGKFLVAQEGGEALQVIQIEKLHFEEGSSVEIADIGCVACGRCIEYVDAYGQVSVRPKANV